MTTQMLPKGPTVDALCEAIAAELHSMESMAEMARDEATSAETKAEGKYDTRATEASYLARGQAWRIAELRKLRSWLMTDGARAPTVTECVQTGALVRVVGARSEWLYVAPIGGGKASCNGETVRIVSLASPLGAAMEGLEVGDAFEVDTPRGRREYEVVAVG